MKKVLLKCINVDGFEGIFHINNIYEFQLNEEYYCSYENKTVSVYQLDIEYTTYSLTINPDEEGLSYKNWFKLVEED